MTQYVKFINENSIEYPPKNKGNIINYNLNIEALEADGYKPFIKAEKDPEKNYNIIYRETETEVIEVAIEIIPDPAELLQQAKENKVNENDTARDEALNSGVVYNGVLFDSDTDQKVNLLATVSVMNDTDVIEWFGMNNYSLECTKEDLINIGNLIIQLHSFCWEKNAKIKNLIRDTQTIGELKNIEINYNEGE